MSDQGKTVVLDMSAADNAAFMPMLSSQFDRLTHAVKESSFFRNIFLTTIASIAIILAALLYMVYWLPKTSEITNNIVSMQVLLQDYAVQSRQLYQTGSVEQLDEVHKTQQQIAKKAKQLRANLSAESIKRIEQMGKDVKYMTENKSVLESMSKASLAVSDNLPTLIDDYQRLEESATSVNQRLVVSKQAFLLEKMMRQMATITNGSDDAFSLINAFTSAKIEFEENLLKAKGGLGYAGDAQQTIADIQETYQSNVAPLLLPIMDLATRFDKIRLMVAAIPDSNKQIRQDLRKVELKSSVGLKQIAPLVVIILGLLGLVLAYLQYSQYKHQEIEAQSLLEAQRVHEQSIERQRQIERNDSAVLRLMEELADLADGDLTINATVSEDSTGAIADSVNYAIEQLRGLVMAINKTAIKVSSLSNSAQSGAMKLAQSSEHQAHEISGVSSAINEMAVSIDDVSRNAMESARVAEQSVDIAESGAELVHRNIEGMDNIREQIQDTSKRIKRLGESSQEIGNIVSLINDITDQTNILALNAAIQASMAGEAGRGFAVVADEVQRLAERSAFATKEIEGLVKTIQADTSEAVVSMEQTTTEVVRGAKLAKDGGKALEEIQFVSKHLSDLIQNISNAARQQAVSAGHIANTMSVIQEITTQNTAGTMDTAKSIGALSEMASELNLSVEGFKLPEQSV